MITGASSDFGMRIIERNFADYEKIIAHYNKNGDRLRSISERYSGKLILKQADLCDNNAVRRMMQELSDEYMLPDHFIHLAAKRIEYKRFRQCTASDFDEELRCSVLSFVEIMSVVLPDMAKKKYGKIAVMLSSCLVSKPPKFMSTYVVSKYALLGTVLALAEEYSDRGICINAVSPIMTDTGFISQVPQMIIDMNREKNVMKRNLCVDDVIPTIEYLLSTASDRVTGQNLFISGVK